MRGSVRAAGVGFAVLAFSATLSGSDPVAAGSAAPLVAIPSFSETVPNFAQWDDTWVSVTFAGSIAATASSRTCPVRVQYDVKVTITPSPASPDHAVATPMSYSWSPSKPLAGRYEVSNMQEGQGVLSGPQEHGVLSGPLVTSAVVTYTASTPPEGTAVTFTIDFFGAAEKQTLRAVSHVHCPSRSRP